MMQMGMPIESSKAKVHCKVLEDNTGAIEIARIPRFCPQTKHLDTKLMHFRAYVDKMKEIIIHKIDNLDQLANYLTKPLNYAMLSKLCKRVMGW